MENCRNDVQAITEEYNEAIQTLKTLPSDEDELFVLKTFAENIKNKK